MGKAAQGSSPACRSATKSFFPTGHGLLWACFPPAAICWKGELIADRDTLMGSAKRDDFNSVLARLEMRRMPWTGFKAALAANPALPVMAERQSDYYEHLSGRRPHLFSTVAYMTGGIMALGAMFGALNIMVGAVRARRQEIGTLRALGFGALAGGDFGGERVSAAGVDRDIDRLGHRLG